MRISDWSSDVCSSDLTAFYRRFRGWVGWCLRHRWLVIGATVLVFMLSLLMFRFVPQQFFPASARLELMVDLKLRSEEHTSELQSLMRISYAVFCLKKKQNSRESHDTL